MAITKLTKPEYDAHNPVKYPFAPAADITERAWFKDEGSRLLGLVSSSDHVDNAWNYVVFKHNRHVDCYQRIKSDKAIEKGLPTQQAAEQRLFAAIESVADLCSQE